MKRTHTENTERSVAEQVEEGLRTLYSRRLFKPFARAVAEYRLVEEGDKIAVCISGGKDSMLMAKLFQELKRHNKFPFGLVFLVMDPGYSEENRALILSNAELLGIPVTLFETDIFENVVHIEKSPCYICARMRRGYLYRRAQELGCNKIALGHHFDDVIETVLMGILYAGQVQTMLPKLDSAHFEGMQLIRPMYYVREKDVIDWGKEYGLRFLRCACKFTEEKDGASGGKRQRVKELIRELKREDPQIERNIFRSTENVNLASVLGYKDREGVRHRFDGEEDE